jgi:hypothetical protein
MNNGNYDFLHGAIGYGFYFFKRYKNTISKRSKERYKKYLLKLIDELEASSEKVNDKFCWISEINLIDKKLTVYDFVMSHGISSIISFFSRLYVYDDFKNEVNDMLRGGVNYLLSQTSNDSASLSVFPNYVCDAEKPEYKSRVAWCYGDLGIALSLWHASEALRDNDLKSFVIEVLKKTAARVQPEQTLVVDACLCHGSFGNAQIFNYIYRQTKQNEFKVAADYWIKDGLEKAALLIKYR